MSVNTQHGRALQSCVQLIHPVSIILMYCLVLEVCMICPACVDDLELSKGIVPVMKRKIHIYRQVADEEQLRSNADTCDYPGYKRVIIHGEGCYTGSKPIYLLWHAGSDNQGSHYDVLVPPQWR